LPVTRRATCPFCGLLCDDLTVEADGAALTPRDGACERSRAAFATLGRAAAAAAAPRVRGQSASPESALDAAAALLARARRPFIGGLGTDVAGMRATLALARRLGAIVDHGGAAAKYRNLHVLQEAGWITATFAEVKNRADLVVLVGDGWRHRFPRFVERLVAPTASLFADRLARRFILLDAAAAAAGDALPRDAEQLALAAPPAGLPALLAMLCALVDEQPAEPARLSDVAPEKLVQAAAWLREARYGVVAWAAADLELAHAELALQALSRLVSALNRTTRFAALPLAGTDGDITANAVQTWQGGLPYPASYANQVIDFDPQRYAMANVLGRGEADCLVWIASLGRDRLPPATAAPVIVLGRADVELAREPDVFLPVATPGIDAPGHLLRSDKVVSLRLPQLRESALPSVARTVDALLARLG
jgi:formylmethanofuran dehydrogenase subunit B